MKFSIIIPVLNESDRINELLNHLEMVFNGYDFEIIISDGDESGSTIKNIKSPVNINLKKILSPKGRAVQMNRGADAGAGEIFIFLHADTLLPREAAKEILTAFGGSQISAGAFDFEFDTKSSALNLISFIARWRSRFTRIPFGDQAVFIRSAFFNRLGGYREIPLMEDVELMKRIRSSGEKIYISKFRVITSARKWLNDGILKNTLRNWRNQILYSAGWSTEKLAEYYYKNRNGIK